MTPDKAKLTRVENNDAFQLDKIDTVRNDEALKVLAENVSAEAWDAAEEKRLVRKIDRKLLSLLCITYGLQVSLLVDIASLRRNHIDSWLCRGRK